MSSIFISLGVGDYKKWGIESMDLNANKFLETLNGIEMVLESDPFEGERLLEKLIEMVIRQRNRFIDQTGDLNDMIVLLQNYEFGKVEELYLAVMEKRK